MEVFVNAVIFFISFIVFFYLLFSFLFSDSFFQLITNIEDYSLIDKIKTKRIEKNIYNAVSIAVRQMKEKRNLK